MPGFNDFMDLGSLIVLLALLLLLILKPNKTRADLYFLASLVFFLIFCWIDLIDLSKHTLGRLANSTIYSLVGPLWYLSIRNYANEARAKKRWIHLIFPGLNISLWVWLWLSKSSTNYFETGLYRFQIFAIFLSMAAYLVLMILAYQQAKFQQAAKSTLNWILVMTIAFIGFTIIALSYWFLSDLSADRSLIWNTDSTISFLILFILALQGYRYGILYPRSQSRPPEADSDESIKWLSLYQSLDQLIQSESLYLNPNLKVEDLAKMMQTNSRYISKAVNLGYGESITQYLNDLRLNHLKERLSDDQLKHLTIDALAMESGFSSKSSLHRIFKQKEGLTPAEYRNQEQIKNTSD